MELVNQGKCAVRFALLMPESVAEACRQVRER